MWYTEPYATDLKVILVPSSELGFVSAAFRSWAPNLLTIHVTFCLAFTQALSSDGPTHELGGKYLLLFPRCKRYSRAPCKHINGCQNGARG